jgi:hypothetical protein
MKIVIDISESIKEHIEDGSYGKRPYDKYLLITAVLNGTPLPKGHGRLIDADMLILNNKDYIVTTSDLESEVRNEMVEWINEDIENAPTIIEADKE